MRYCGTSLNPERLSPGVRLGPYEVVSRIGAGGMGEVWKARDTRLDRSVAIKVLPAELAQHAQLRLRFEREAKTISQLNHPNICTLYDVGDDYLVMELLEGESLAERIARGPLPIDEVLRNGVQVAQALDKAHRAGVVHRDIKPGNVMITKSGAKLLDFGLAKASTIEVSVADATQHKPLTQEGTILGTFQYMSPEQLEGIEADARSDIFALGAVLYEMATARRAFDREDEDEPDRRDRERTPAADRRAPAAHAAGTPARGRQMPGQGSGRSMAERARRRFGAAVDRRRRLAGGSRCARRGIPHALPAKPDRGSSRRMGDRGGSSDCGGNRGKPES